MTNVIMHGACGRMGQAIICTIINDKDSSLVGAVDQKTSSYIGQPVSEAMHLNNDVIIEDSLTSSIEKADCVIDFSHHTATIPALKLAEKYQKGFVVGTTAHTDEEIKAIKEISKNIPIVFSPNMSVGVNMLFVLAKLLAEKMPKDYDIEITEAHHRLKKDAPSGTAKKLAELIAAGRGVDLNKEAKYGRCGDGVRSESEIGVHVLRAGSIIGDHTALFANDVERLEITHKAESRDAFAKGALLSAKYVSGRQSGLYSMLDVLGIN